MRRPKYYIHPSNLNDGETEKERASSLIALAFRYPWDNVEGELRDYWGDKLVDEFLRLPNRDTYIEDYIHKYN